MYLFGRSFDAPYQIRGGALQFCASLFTVLLIGVSMLALAGRHLSQAWQEKGDSDEVTEKSGSRWYSKFFGPAFRAGLGNLPSGNPYHWLASRDLRPKYKTRAFACAFFPIWFCFVIVGCFASTLATKIFCLNAAVFMAYGFHHALKWLIAFESSRRLSEDRHSGALELLLVTPVSVEDIIAGQKRALRELFQGPILLAILTNG